MSMEMKQRFSEVSTSTHSGEFKVTPIELSENGEERVLSGIISTDGTPLALKAQTGGWKCAMLILVNQGLITLAFAGVEVNLVLFSKSVLRQTNAEAANTFSRWLGTVYLCSLGGAFLSDSYLGRYKTCVIFQVVFAIGLISTSLCTHLFLLEPRGCGKIGEQCNPHSTLQTAFFYISIYMVAIGNGAPEPALAAFGADQFDDEDPKEKLSKASFYGYFYVAVNMGCLVAETLLVYVENMGHWVVVFWLCTGCAVVSYVLLLSGTARYRYFKVTGNPISRFSQVIVASFRKMKLEMPFNGEGLYEVYRDGEDDDQVKSSRTILHTHGLKFLDRAAIVTDTADKGAAHNPWELCPVTQVEEVKCIVRLLPIWLCTILSSVAFVQMISLFVEQGAAMDTSLGPHFNIPPASMTAFDMISTSAFIILYDKLILPLLVRLTNKTPKQPTELQRIGIGLAIAAVAMIIAGLVEQYRLRHASPEQEMSSLSIFWQTPQYVMVGVSEAFVYVAQMEFFSSQAPDGLKSIGIGLSMSSSAIGSYLSSIILSVVMSITSRDGKPGWVPPNLNEGHLDRFFFLIAGLMALNLGIFVICAKRYKSILLQKRDEAAI